MPFESEAQRRWMYSQYPKMAAEWEKHTGKKKLPEYKHPEEKPLYKYFKEKKK